jgi:tetratricopeptide (TPR) repeat protein
VALRSFILGERLSDLGGLNDARQHYLRALQIIESSYGPDNLDAAVILNNLGKTARAQNDMAEARKFFAMALGIFSSNLGGDNLYSTTIEEHLNSLPQTQLLQENVDDDYDDGFYF